jgi:hypothetical protein
MLKSTPSGGSKKKRVEVILWIARRSHKHATTGKGKEQKCCAPELLYSRRVSSGIAVTSARKANTIISNEGEQALPRTQLKQD